MMELTGRHSNQTVCKIDADPNSDNRWGYTGECEVVQYMPDLNFADTAMASDRAYFGMFVNYILSLYQYIKLGASSQFS